MNNRRSALLGLLAKVSLLSSPVLAQTFPTRPIKLMLTFIKSVPANVERLTKRDSAAWGPIIDRLGIAQ
ncbi:hypothetical protein VLK31_35225 [Variovorax sp. H27-G14]|uniref:hypothetical protein n=1 Tax=Variovorax sp. H27-G14 TaxID=3111914 RepID=UPI0038FCD8A6